MTKRLHMIVMYSDIAGFEEIKQEDGEKAFKLQSRSRKIHKNCIHKHHGTLIKGIGEKMLASFHLPADAVRCAAEIQRKAKNTDLPLKIGIHEGEMIYKGLEVYGEAVDTAHKLEESSQEGCVTISGQVFHHVKEKKGFTADYKGEKTFGEPAQPVKLYQIKCDSQDKDKGSSPIISNWKRHKTPYIVIGILVLILMLTFLWGWLLFPVLKDKIQKSKDNRESSLSIVQNAQPWGPLTESSLRA